MGLAEAEKVKDTLRSLPVVHKKSIEIIEQSVAKVSGLQEPLRREFLKILNETCRKLADEESIGSLREFYQQYADSCYKKFTTFLFASGPKAFDQVPAQIAEYPSDEEYVKGFELLNRYFDELLTINPKVVAFGEDLGKIGDVNQGFAGLQEKYGEHRVFDTGIRELTIMGQGIGLALRGLRPIAEIQYLDYLMYGLQPLSDDVACLHYRTAGQQSCPIIVRTRGHRLEGIWHTGSPMSMAISALRGMHFCVPRNMTQAIGLYNTILQTNDPAVMVECLNGYRLREKLFTNLTEYKVPLGVPEVITEGDDITIVSYGALIKIIEPVCIMLADEGIYCELIDVQTLLPFDTQGLIVKSLQKTNRILFVDEDVPGGATAYMYNEVIEKQKGYKYLDVAPRTMSAAAHRTAYGSDGDYFCKPNAEQIETLIREMIAE